jgi:peptidoglycan/xylan/chitin deacetylase (PgdA/CDA1 family)
MSYLKSLIYAGCASPPVLALLRARTPSVHTTVLMYHELARDDVDIEAWTVLRESDFLRQVAYLVRHYDIVGIGEAIERVETAARPARPMAVITFDDGDRGNAAVLLPIVEKIKLPVTIYVATQQVAESRSYWFDRIVNALQTDKPVTVDLRAYGLKIYAINRVRGARNWASIQQLLQDLKSLAHDARMAAVNTTLTSLGGLEHRKNSRVEPLGVADVKTLSTCPYVTIGAHSHCHSILTQLNPAEAEESVRLSKTLLEQWTGQTIAHFAYPNGSYDDSVMEVVRRAGFVSAVTTEPRLWQPQDALHAIPRIGIGRYDSMEQFKLNLVGGIRQLLPWRYRAKSAFRPASQSYAS